MNMRFGDGGLSSNRVAAAAFFVLLLPLLIGLGLRLPPQPLVSSAQSSSQSLPPKAYDRFLKHKVEINTATAEQWAELPGIGPVLSERIVEHRDRIGGFLSIEEVQGIRGLKRNWPQFAPYLLFDAEKGKALRTQHRQQQQNQVRLDLNTSDSASVVQRAGLPPSLARKLLRFRKACGGFEDWKHVARTRDLTPAQLHDLQAAFVLRPPPCIDLNRATAADLDRLRGIGEKRSKGILKYKEILGFYARKEQLQEVYNLPDSVYQQIKHRVCVQSGAATRPQIEVNLWNAEELSKHPYLRPRKFAQALVKHRSKNGPFPNLESLFAVEGIDSNKVARLGPYLKF